MTRFQLFHLKNEMLGGQFSGESFQCFGCAAMDVQSRRAVEDDITLVVIKT